jgi:hypothetical protein
VWTGQTDKIQADAFRQIFNQKDNSTGMTIKCIIGSKTISEGISFNNLRHIHVIDPWWNISLIRQVIARGIRYGRHCDLFRQDSGTIPTTNIYRHIARFRSDMVPLIPNKQHIMNFMTIEQYMTLTSSIKNTMVNVYDSIVKEEAVDCKAFKHGNIYRLEERRIPDPLNPLRYIVYYQNPLNSKKYKIQGDPLNFDYTSLSLEEFTLFPTGTVFVEHIVHESRKMLEPTNIKLIVGHHLTPSLIGQENIECTSK